MKYQKLNPNAKPPVYESADAAGADLCVCSAQKIVIEPGETVCLHTGIAVEIPKDHVGLILARSSLGIQRGLAPANKVGVIDADYRGELQIALFNHSKMPQTLAPYERVAQLVIVPCIQVTYEETDALQNTERGTGGFGSTGRI